MNHAFLMPRRLGKSRQELDEKDFEAIVSALDATTAISVSDAKGKILYANDRLLELSKYTRADLIGRNHRIMKSGRHPDEYYADLWKTIVSGKVWRGETMDRAKDGSIYWVDTAIAPVLDKTFRPYRYVAVRFDITERKRLESDLFDSIQELGQEKVRMDATIGSIGDGIVVLDKEGKIVFLNPFAEQMLGWKFDDLKHEAFCEKVRLEDERGNLIPTKDLPAQRAFLTGERISTKELYFVRHDKTRFPADITATPILFQGESIGCVGIIRDISREKKIDRAKMEFVALAAHQLRTPLSALKWYSEALLEGHAGAVGAKQTKYLSQLRESNQRMVDLIDALLDVSRLELGSFRAEPKPTDVVAVVQASLSVFEREIEQKNLAVAETHVLVPKTVLVDAKFFGMVLQNLLANAVHYTPPNGSVRVVLALNEAQDALSLEVSDTGIGIPPNQQKRIFEKLFRADNALEMNPNGTGLGLYIAKSIVDMLGGTIRFTSALGKGTTFFVSFPVSLK